MSSRSSAWYRGSNVLGSRSWGEYFDATFSPLSQLVSSFLLSSYKRLLTELAYCSRKDAVVLAAKVFAKARFRGPNIPLKSARNFFGSNDPRSSVQKLTRFS